ncbi:UbiH/UbiF family hydroxylase [Agrobacterium vitis]|uniref:UbiH/UbiF family hydroxylase n=1 Tax=Rhizobium/Agrobacterium group TaxID=227290 RepID=UPI0012E83449|nr:MULTISPECIES: UbiH/UbiF family hydroxylase [Rhizobium/Agrobacterium group]MCF1448717.1 UbiH/UbiF family hydroxylase [Allorhizobium ampelinum]MCF1494596.1 UbiH/UbiF family hydroxylase [Allorhizobium ampelinum]MVA47561.1 UbiH/UbiF family hydroxylase [Agrobacterium vitis]
METVDVTVIGAGLAGSVAALALARRGRKVTLVAGDTRPKDRRTTALMDQSIRFLDRLGLWEELKTQGEALSTMQIIDGTKRLLRAPPVAFRSSEIGLAAFGYNFQNSDLLDVFDAALAREPNLTVLHQQAASIDFSQDNARVTLADNTVIECDLVVGADGRHSMTRGAADVAVRTWSYPQTAVVLNFTHTLPHNNVSTEFHTETGPFTQVPLKGNRSSLVWVVEPEEAERLKSLPLNDLSVLVETRMQSLLGQVTAEAPAQAWPLSGMSANRYGKGRAVFIGEAAHAFPPIGAQGLNLSLRDIMVLEDLVGHEPQKPLGSTLGDRFDRRRKVDVWSRTASVDLLNRSLLSSFLPVQMVRAAGIHLLSNLSPLRHFAMREGVAPGRGFGAFPQMIRDKIKSRF